MILHVYSTWLPLLCERTVPKSSAPSSFIPYPVFRHHSVATFCDGAACAGSCDDGFSLLLVSSKRKALGVAPTPKIIQC
jgi:hypothetical protein